MSHPPSRDAPLAVPDARRGQERRDGKGLATLGSRPTSGGGRHGKRRTRVTGGRPEHPSWRDELDQTTSGQSRAGLDSAL